MMLQHGSHISRKRPGLGWEDPPRVEIGKNAAPVEDDGLWMERKAELKAKCTCILRAVMPRMLVVMCVGGGGGCGGEGVDGTTEGQLLNIVKMQSGNREPGAHGSLSLSLREETGEKMWSPSKGLQQ